MTIEQLREALISKPFKPFEVCLSDGRQIRVPSPEFVWAVPGAVRTFVIGTSQETYRIIDLLHVASLDFGNGQAAAHNGKKKR